MSPFPRNAHGIWRQNYVVLFPGSEMSAGLHSSNLIFGIKFYRMNLSLVNLNWWPID